MLFVPPTTRRPSVGFHFMHSGVARPKMSKKAHDTSLPPYAPPMSSSGFFSHSCTATVCSGSAPHDARYLPSAEKARSMMDAL